MARLKRKSISVIAKLRNYFITGIVVLVPIGITFYLVKFFVDLALKNKKISNNSIFLLLISFSSLILLFQTLHSMVTFKFSCGLVIVFIIIFNRIHTLKDKELKLIYTSIIFFLGLSSFEFVKNNSNQTYVYQYKKDDYVKNNYFNYFSSNRLDQKTWSHLIELSKKIEDLKKNCNISKGVNLSKDGIVSVILRDKIDLIQKIPWYENKKRSWMNKYYNTFLKYFDVNLINEIKESLQKNNIIIYTDRENYPTMNILDEEIDFKKEMNFIKLIYSYENKNKILIFPRHCSKVIS